jgi:arylsulfatase A-like enzyme
MRYSDLMDDHLGASPESLRRYGSVLANAYRLVDRTIGEILDVAGDASVVVVSDHGFAIEPKGGGRDYSHETNGPDGIFVASGRPFATGVVDGLAVEDILPILLRARGLPMTPDLADRVDPRVFRPEFLRATAPMLVKDYAGWQAPSLQPSSDKGDEEMFERLRALGYLN